MVSLGSVLSHRPLGALLDEMASFPLLRGKGLIIPFADGCAAL
jgi:hypothetical protein